LARPVLADFEWIPQQGWSADVNALAAIVLLILDPNHLNSPFSQMSDRYEQQNPICVLSI